MASSFSIESVWRALHDAPEPWAHRPSTLGVSSMPGQAWSRTPGPSGLDGLWSFGRSSVARVMRLRHALEDSVPLAFEQLQRLLGAISFAEVRQVLAALVRDIALVWCGSVIMGSGAGAALGALGFGVGAIPGAALGAEVGAAAGEALLAMFGLKALAESMVASMPRALRAYRQGARNAWDDPPFHDPHDEHDTFRTRQAAWELAQGHLALLQALLTAMLAMLARGGTARALALHEIGANSRLGPAVARWLEEREGALQDALERAGLRDITETARVPSRADAPLVTPAQLRAEAESRKSPPTRPFGATRPARVGNVEGSPVLRQTGAGGPVAPEDAYAAAERTYEQIRADTTDVAKIAENTGIKPENIQKVKDHVFYDEHLLDRYRDYGVEPEWSRFDADPSMAGSWQRLTDGNFTDVDMQLLRHETAEAWYMKKYGPSYLDAHMAADLRYPSPY